ncbi:hypothetical protein EQ826_15485 [Ectopseudomonas mendocina]|nr:hypothetical protein [Pseudomonas mendocina]TRO20903.1 hypothetical protein EQ828_15280 [Pseudomonas mendocina]TRO24860.1 hypothetical protein EQ826_15485 [Pseudomonas mendocina]
MSKTSEKLHFAHHSSEELGIELKRLIYPRISIEAYADHDPSEDHGEGSYRAVASALYEKSERLLHVNFFFSTDEENRDNHPYKFNLHCYICASVTNDFSDFEDIKRQSAYIILGTMLIGSMREMVCTLTGRGPWDSVLMPSFNIDEFVLNLMQNYSEE